MGGVTVIRVKSYIAANEGFLKRILDYVSFMVTGGIVAMFQKRPDILITTSPQFFCAVAGVGGVAPAPAAVDFRAA